MTGLITIGMLAVLTAVLLRLAGLRGMMFVIVVVALVNGGLSFNALNREPLGSPDRVEPRLPPVSLAADRFAFMGRFTASERWLGMADAIASRGNTADAAGVLSAAVRQHPRDYALWIGLGNMLTAHTGGLNPGARLAYERAIEIAPNYPAPRYFLGVAEARSGNVTEARRLWTEVLANAPANASWRPLVEDRLADSAPPVPTVR